MDVDEALESIKRVLKPERLGAVEQMVFRHSWLGKTYREIAEISGYNSDYIKDIGFRLWQDLSEAIGAPVTKKIYTLILIITSVKQVDIESAGYQNLASS